MKGFIKITADEGLTVECRLKHVGKFDKMMLLHSFMEALEMDQNAVIEAIIVNDLAEKVRNGLMEKLSGCDDDDEEESPITLAQFDLDAIEKLYGKKKDQQEDS